MCNPFQNRKRKKVIHVEIDQKKGLLAVGGSFCVTFGSTRDEGGRGEGERKG
jgi:hypothetical protein